MRFFCLCIYLSRCRVQKVIRLSCDVGIFCVALPTFAGHFSASSSEKVSRRTIRDGAREPYGALDSKEDEQKQKQHGDKANKLNRKNSTVDIVFFLQPLASGGDKRTVNAK